MELNNYQAQSQKTAIYPKDRGLEYVTLGLVGEAGEIANKVKKIIRDNNSVCADDHRKDLAKELGDVLWYCAALASELGVELNTVAQANVDKLTKRKENGVLQGSGDNR